METHTLASFPIAQSLPFKCYVLYKFIHHSHRVINMLYSPMYVLYRFGPIERLSEKGRAANESEWNGKQTAKRWIESLEWFKKKNSTKPVYRFFLFFFLSRIHKIFYSFLCASGYFKNFGIKMCKNQQIYWFHHRLEGIFPFLELFGEKQCGAESTLCWFIDTQSDKFYAAARNKTIQYKQNNEKM